MTRWVLICGLAMLLAAGARAQDEFPKFEVSAGYSYLHVGDTGISDNLNGISASVDYNEKSWIGGVFDFGVYHGGPSTIDGHITSYQFGPRVVRRGGKFTPFAQLLFGGANLSSGAFSQTSIAASIGGGADYDWKEHLGFRVLQAEYMLTKFNDTTGRDRQGNVRLSVGVVLRF